MRRILRSRTSSSCVAANEDLTNIAPKRPNWDLRRDLDERLKRAERRTKEATLLLIRAYMLTGRRLAESGAESDAATAAATASAEADADDDADANGEQE